MNLSKLFETQKVLDDRIIAEHKLEGQNLLPGTILALQVELGELANEWQGFKHWKVDPQPKPNTLEEYVDGLHLSLSIMLSDVDQYGASLPLRALINEESFKDLIKDENLIDQFNSCFTQLGLFSDSTNLREFTVDSEAPDHFENFFRSYLGLGKMLGFTWSQIEQAYFKKNKINHTRQDEKY